MEPDIECVWEAGSEGEAEQIRAFLRANKIPAELRGDAIDLYGLPLTGVETIKICVPSPHVAEARQLLTRVEAGELELSPSDEPLGPAS